MLVNQKYLSCHQCLLVGKPVMSAKLKCHPTKVSPKLKCHKNKNVLKIKIKIKIQRLALITLVLFIYWYKALLIAKHFMLNILCWKYLPNMLGGSFCDEYFVLKMMCCKNCVAYFVLQNVYCTFDIQPVHKT